MAAPTIAPAKVPLETPEEISRNQNVLHRGLLEGGFVVVLLPSMLVLLRMSCPPCGESAYVIDLFT
jgi:hypothetical protein